MLKPVVMTEKVAATLSAQTKVNKGLDKTTGDIGDLVFYKTADGKQTYLRVWEGADFKAGEQAGPKWYEVTPIITSISPLNNK